jgi:hypothetical protein
VQPESAKDEAAIAATTLESEAWDGRIAGRGLRGAGRGRTGRANAKAVPAGPGVPRQRRAPRPAPRENGIHARTRPTRAGASESLAMSQIGLSEQRASDRRWIVSSGLVPCPAPTSRGEQEHTPRYDRQGQVGIAFESGITAYQASLLWPILITVVISRVWLTAKVRWIGEDCSALSIPDQPLHENLISDSA